MLKFNQFQYVGLENILCFMVVVGKMTFKAAFITSQIVYFLSWQDSSQHQRHCLLYGGQPDGRGRVGVYLDEVPLVRSCL